MLLAGLFLWALSESAHFFLAVKCCCIAAVFVFFFCPVDAKNVPYLQLKCVLEKGFSIFTAGTAVFYFVIFSSGHLYIGPSAGVSARVTGVIAGVLSHC